MARERYVTRTVELTVCEVLAMDIVKAEAIVLTAKISAAPKNPNDLIKAIKKQYDTPTLKCVAVQSTTKESVLYGMPEADFLLHAKILPPRTAAE